MATGYVVRKNEYHDSVFLMRVAKRLSEQKGVQQAAALMGTEKNKGLLAAIGFSGGEISVATPNDLILAVKAESQQILEAVLASIDQGLRPDPSSRVASAIRTLNEALARQPNSNLAVVSVPGAYAAGEAQKALEKDLNVFLFSDNVPVESERSLKEYARERGLIVMGPDCGTAIIGGVGIGFANVVRRGPIGVIGASGTGIQEITTLVHRAGSGISHALGTGSRDLADDIGGISLLSALDALESDEGTKIIVIVSKPPGRIALASLIPRITQCTKPVVTCFLGLKKNLPYAGSHHKSARTLDEAADQAIQLASGLPPAPFKAESPDFKTLIHRERAGKRPEQKYIRGIFAGGTFCYQAQQVLQDFGLDVYSNGPLEGSRKLSNPFCSTGNTLVDMGADEFTAGRPHPMIDSSLRRERILNEAQDPQVAILLLDFILGFNSSPDPAGELAAAIIAAKEGAREKGGSLSVVASMCGTEGDPQDWPQQVKRLEEAGAVVFPSGALAAQFCGLLAAGLQEAAGA